MNGVFNLLIFISISVHGLCRQLYSFNVPSEINSSLYDYRFDLCDKIKLVKQGHQGAILTIDLSQVEERILNKTIPCDKGALLVLGFLKARMDEEISLKIEREVKLRQALYLAQARTGNQARINSLLRKTRTFPLDDAFTYEALPSLVYVRQKPVFDYLFELIESDALGCTPNGPPM